jgi:hypothetical protein
MVVAIQNYIHFFGFTKETLECCDFKVCYKLDNTAYVQKIVFHNKNEIVVISDTGQHFVYDFSAEIKISKPPATVIQRTMPYMPLLYPKKQLFYDDAVVVGDYICSLVREERKVNWFSYKAKQIMRSFFSSHLNPEWILESRKIEFYKIDREKGLVTLEKFLPEARIVDRIKMKLRGVWRDDSQLKIVGINLKKGSESMLEIVLGAGMFISVDIQNGFNFQEEVLELPSQTDIGVTGFFLQKTIKRSESNKDRPKPIVSSLGTSNLTITEDSVIFFGQNSIEVVKSGGFKGKLAEIKSSFLSQSSWLLLTKKGFFEISRLTPR